jgi:hypothetical protein
VAAAAPGAGGAPLASRVDATTGRDDRGSDPVNPQAIIAALPWLRRLWRLTPPPLRVPLLLLVAVVGLVQFFQGRKAGSDGSSGGRELSAGREGDSLFV